MSTLRATRVLSFERPVNHQKVHDAAESKGEMCTTRCGSNPEQMNVDCNIQPPQSREYGIDEIVKSRFWPWLLGKRHQNLLKFSFLAQNRCRGLGDRCPRPRG